MGFQFGENLSSDKIIITGAREHNLRNINLELPRNQFVVITGISGSGKSSLAFDTLYAEGQRRYVESLSAYARQFLGLMEKPDVDNIEGLSPAISIEQKTTHRNPRSTVGTVTEIYDYLRLLYARIGKPYCYRCGRPVERQSVQQIVDTILAFPEGERIMILSPQVRGRKGEYKDVFERAKRDGFIRVRVDGSIMDLSKPIRLDKNKQHSIEIVIDRLVVKKSVKDRLTDSIELALSRGDGIVFIERVDVKKLQLFSQHFACAFCEVNFDELAPRLFSFNSPYGACPNCDGLGFKKDIDPELIVPDESKSLLDGCVKPIGSQPKGSWYSAYLKSLSRAYNFRFTTPWKRLNPEAQQILLYGSKGEKVKIEYYSERFRGEFESEFEGVIPNLKRRYLQTKSQGIRAWIEQFMSEHACEECHGARLKKEALSVKIGNFSIAEVTALSIADALQFFENLQLTQTEQHIARQIFKEVKSRLNFLASVGVNYLTLNRTAGTLSGGEAQRIRLATQIGSQLVGVMYILDEPSIGLHQRDNMRLIETLVNLRDLGNTILVVEHDREMMESADVIVDLGPGAGIHGGELVAVGTQEEIIREKKSLTGQYLGNKKKIHVPKRINKGNGKTLQIIGAEGNNLKKVNAEFPLGRMICVTGVSGSGKSTLINRTLYPVLVQKLTKSQAYPLKYQSIEGTEHIDKVISIDQSPIGRTPRSNPATYTGLFTYIRDLFAQLPESKMRGYKPGRFSFNVMGGRCEVCQGDGVKKIEMHFLPDVYVTCEICNGKRYNRETLEIHYKGKSIAEVLQMTVEEALAFFENIVPIKRRLKTLNDVGLGYIHLGQQATTLSGGEAQRVKLATELAKIGTGNTLYILDEPTIGLHFEDVKMLLKVLSRIVSKGNTVIIIEHNLDVIKCADYIVDLGPEGGDAGGKILAAGTLKEIARKKKSYTGQYLRKILKDGY